MFKRPGSRLFPRRGLSRFADAISLFLAALGVSAFAGDDSPPGTGGKESGRVVTVTAVKGDEHNWIVALNPAASGWEKIVPSGSHARLSPDGTTLAFGIDTGLWTCPLKLGARPTHVGEIGNPEAMRLLTSAKVAWTPDGKTIIATGARGTFPQLTFETLRFDLRSKGGTKLPVPGTDIIEDISPDGRWLLTSRTRGLDSPQGLFRMRLDGTGGVRLTRGGAFAGRFSPDGSKILYGSTGVEAENEGLFLVDADGSNRRRLHPSPALACWSPDGKRIAFTGTPTAPVRFDNAEKAPPAKDNSRFVGSVVLIGIDGKNRVVHPTPTGGIAFQPDWR